MRTCAIVLVLMLSSVLAVDELINGSSISTKLSWKLPMKNFAYVSSGFGNLMCAYVEVQGDAQFCVTMSTIKGQTEDDYSKSQCTNGGGIMLGGVYSLAPSYLQLIQVFCTPIQGAVTCATTDVPFSVKVIEVPLTTPFDTNVSCPSF